MNDRSLFTIAHAARIVGTSASTIRFWEKRGLIAPYRDGSRYRRFSLEDIQRLKRVKVLKSTGQMGIEAIRETIAQEFPHARRAAPAARTDRQIGQRLRKLRLASNLTLEDVAARAGLSVGFLSSIERSKYTASIATLQKLARFYNTNVLSFFGQGTTHSKLVTAKQREVLTPQPGLRLELLAVGPRSMEPHIFRVAPGTESGGSYYHEGEEFLFVLEGTFEVWLDEVERYVLTAGDSLCFSSTQTHRWLNPGTKESVVLWINTPPTF